MRSAGRLIRQVCAKTFQNGIVLLESFHAVIVLAWLVKKLVLMRQRARNTRPLPVDPAIFGLLTSVRAELRGRARHALPNRETLPGAPLALHREPETLRGSPCDSRGHDRHAHR